MAGRANPDLLVIVGPTASGKSELAMRLAKRFNAEIIAADSRTLYKTLDIGTAKPTRADRRAVPHWGLDLIRPNQQFSAADFKNYAVKAIEQIRKRGNLPILVGGSGLYIDSVLFDYKFGPTAEAARRQALEGLDINELQSLIQKQGLTMPENQRNKRHLIRTLERQGEPLARSDRPRAGSVIVGLLPPDEVLRQRINKRAEIMFGPKLLEEMQGLLARYPEIEPGELGIVYGYAAMVLKGELELEKALEIFKTKDWQYARRQRTWFRRDPYIQWFTDIDAAQNHLTMLLNT